MASEIDLQSWWEVPSIAHFSSLFTECFGLLDFDIEEFEEWIIEDGQKPEGSPFLRELIRRLLKGCYKKRSINHENYEFFFRDFIKKKWELEQGRENPFYQPDVNIHSLPLRTKVEMLQALCEYRLQSDDVISKLKRMETDDLRKVPVGKDSDGALYWYFYGTRLYREVPDPSTIAPQRKKPGPKPGSKRKRKQEAEEDDPFTDKSDVEKSVGKPKKRGQRFGSVSAMSTAKQALKPKRLQDLLDNSALDTTNDSDSSLSMFSFPFPIIPPPTESPTEGSTEVGVQSTQESGSNLASTQTADTNVPSTRPPPDTDILSTPASSVSVSASNTPLSRSPSPSEKKNIQTSKKTKILAQKSNAKKKKVPTATLR